ncbi:MAG: glycoside hydrolase family 2 TIM barrel-domain containing protein [Gammaproteobacteria bacterium]
MSKPVVSRFIEHLASGKTWGLAGLIMVISMLSGCSESDVVTEQPIKVEVVKQGGRYHLHRNGVPYTVRGAGYTGDDLSFFKAHGGNAIRTWATHRPDGASMMGFLDEAHALGISVSLNLPVPAARWKVDYTNEQYTAELMAKLKTEVLKYKDHPALLTWFIGNELDHAATDFAVYDFVDDVAVMIKQIDPNHPTTTTLTGLKANVLNEVNQRAPNLDFVSFQVYGQIHNLPEFVQSQQIKQPIMITEWGAIGFWEMPQTEWGAPIEMTSTAKASNYHNSYQKISAVNNIMIGNYVFLWGQKQERTPTWFGLFTDRGEKTEAVNVMQHIWTGEWPDNRAPQISQFNLNNYEADDNITLTAGQPYPASVGAIDPDGDGLSYRWEVKPESDSNNKGGDYEEAIANLSDSVANQEHNKASIIAPKQPGAYRLFVYVNDNNNHVGHANIPFRVVAEASQPN